LKPTPTFKTSNNEKIRIKQQERIQTGRENRGTEERAVRFHVKTKLEGNSNRDAGHQTGKKELTQTSYQNRNTRIRKLLVLDEELPLSVWLYVDDLCASVV
jgi:hypothetical protein